MVIFPAISSCDPLIERDEFYLKVIAVSEMILVSTFFDTHRKIPFVQSYGQFLHTHRDGCRFFTR